jgi:hypothetical protein
VVWKNTQDQLVLLTTVQARICYDYKSVSDITLPKPRSPILAGLHIPQPLIPDPKSFIVDGLNGLPKMEHIAFDDLQRLPGALLCCGCSIRLSLWPEGKGNGVPRPETGDTGKGGAS